MSAPRQHFPGLFADGPGNQRDRERCRRLSPEDQRWASDRARRWYDDGRGRTLAWSWHRALDEALDPEIVEEVPMIGR